MIIRVSAARLSNAFAGPMMLFILHEGRRPPSPPSYKAGRSPPPDLSDPLNFPSPRQRQRSVLVLDDDDLGMTTKGLIGRREEDGSAQMRPRRWRKGTSFDG